MQEGKSIIMYPILNSDVLGWACSAIVKTTSDNNLLKECGEVVELVSVQV